MRPLVLILSLLLPILVAAQSTSSPPAQSTSSAPAQSPASGTVAPSGNSNSTQPANTQPSVIQTTSFTTFITLASGRVPSTITSGIVLNITVTPTQASSAPASSNSSSSSSSSTSTGPLPTAPTDVDGGGFGSDGAPYPGQSAPGGVLGPPDTYTSAVLAAHINTVLAVVAGMTLGGVLVLS